MTSLLRTSFCDLLGIDLPIVQAPIGSATRPVLAGAVSNAGGLGMLAVTWRDPDTVRRMVRETRELTERPFGANLVLRWPPEERLELCLEEGVEVISLAWGDPGPYVESVHSAGARLLHAVGSADESRTAADAGADVIVAQGWEAGGHVRGGVGTLPLVPRVVEAVHPRPVLAAGGIADGRGLVAVLALGAAGVMMGTRFLASEEADVHPDYRDAVLRAAETDTAYGQVFDIGWPDAPHRVLQNSTVAGWEAAIPPAAGARPGEADVVASDPDGRPVVPYSDVIPLSGTVGEVEALALYMGQSAGLVGRIQPAGEIVARWAERPSGSSVAWMERRRPRPSSDPGGTRVRRFRSASGCTMPPPWRHDSGASRAGTSRASTSWRRVGRAPTTTSRCRASSRSRTRRSWPLSASR